MSVIMMGQVAESIFGSAGEEDEPTPSVHVNISKSLHIRRDEEPSPLSNVVVAVPTEKMQGGGEVKGDPPAPQGRPPRPLDGMDRGGGSGKGDGKEGGADNGNDSTLKSVGAKLELGKTAMLTALRGVGGQQGGAQGINTQEEDSGAARAWRERREKEQLEDNYWNQFVGQDGPSEVSHDS